jgi:signal transduction histidine kinase
VSPVRAEEVNRAAVSRAERIDDVTSGSRLPADLRAVAAIASQGGEGAALHAVLVDAADSVVPLAIEGVEVPQVDELVAALADVARFDQGAARSALYRAAARDPRFLELDPGAALAAQLRLFCALAPAAGASLWLADLSGEMTLAQAAGAVPRAWRAAAVRALARDSAAEPESRRVHAVPVVRLRRKVGALVARVDARTRPLLAELARVVTPLLERDLLLRDSGARDDSLHAASERRLLRVGFDLHDGPLQEIAALAAELNHLRGQVLGLEAGELREIMAGRLDDVTSRLVEIDRSLREVSQSLETSSLADRPLVESLEREASAFARRTGIEVGVDASGTFRGLSASQRIAVLRIAQEALSNIREHSIATSVSVALRSDPDGLTLSVTDNGQGFEVSETVVAAAKRGRLGIVGMSERVRLLGGVFEIASVPGSGTTITVALPAWAPAATAVEAAG